MNSIKQLQKQIQLLTDEINDVFHVTELNLEAVKIRLNQNQKGQSTNSTIINCQKQYQNFKKAYQQRNNLRLQYLITEQIKLQEDKVRRERLLEYQDKIYDQRRLIVDKQAFYDTLIKPKKKRPVNMSIQQFTMLRTKQKQEEQKKIFVKLQDETQQLLKLQKLFRNQTHRLEQELNKMDIETGISQLTPQQVQTLISLAKQSPVLYDSLHITKNVSSNIEQSRQLLDQYIKLTQQDKQLFKQYQQQKQMNKYLIWQNKDLIRRYKDLKAQIDKPQIIEEQDKKAKKQKLLLIDNEIINKRKNFFKNERHNSCFQRSVSL